MLLSAIHRFNQILDRKQKRKIIPLFCVMVISAAFEVLGVSMMVPLITAVTTPDIVENSRFAIRVCRVLGISTHRNFVLACLWVLIAIFIIKNIFLFFQNNVQNDFVYKNRLATQQKLLHAFLSKDYEYYLNASTGEIIRIVQSDAQQAYKLLLNLVTMCSESVVSLTLIVTIFVIDWRMTLFVAFMMAAIMFVIVKILRPMLVIAGRRQQANIAATNSILLQCITGIKEIKVYQKEKTFEDEYGICGENVVCSEKTQSILQNIPRMLIEMIAVCSMLTIFALEIMHGREIDALLPALGAFAMASVKLMPASNRIVSSINQVAYCFPALDKLAENLSGLNDLQAVYNGSGKLGNISESHISLKDSIQFKEITYCYPQSDKPVLEAASLTVPIGHSVGIVGTSGVGKTTVVDIMMGLLKPKTGQIMADGMDVSLYYEEWLAHIGYIPQMVFMMDSSIRENVAFGVPKEEIDNERVWECLAAASISEFVQGLPEQLNTVIGERGIRISGGQRQRIGIARALYKNPDILVFDEATSSLDNETENAIIDAVNSLHGKKTMVIIAHRIQTIEGCDIVYRVENRKIVQER